MSYNNDGGCCGGLNMPFSIPFPGTQSNGWSNGNDMFGWLMMLFFFSLFGFGNNGVGGRGAMPFMGCAGGSGNIAAEAAAYVGQQNTADKVSGIATGVDAIAGIATANGVKVETVKDLTAAGFAGVNTNLCELGNNIAQQFSAQTMNNMQNHNNLTSQLTEMRFANAQCCCDTKQLIQSSFCTLKADTMKAIADSTAAITARLDAAEKAALQEKIDMLAEQKSALKAQLDNQAQTSTLLAAIQAQCAPKCSPCAPVCNPCDPQQILQKALYENWVAKTLDTTTTTSAA